VVNSRQFLVEEIPLQKILDQLAALPPQTASLRSNRASRIALGTLPIPSIPPQRNAKTQRTALYVAKADLSKQPGFAVDYDLYGALTNFTLSPTTYLITNTVNIYGCTIEGGAVLKFSTNAAAQINLPQGVTCKTGPYRFAILTAKDDDTVGTAIATSTHTPVGFYGSGLQIQATNVSLSYIRFAYSKAALGLGVSVPYTYTLSDLQFVNCEKALVPTDLDVVILRNALATGIGSFFAFGNSAVLRAENVTVNGCNYLNEAKDGDLRFTNSLLVAVTNLSSQTYTITTNNTVTLSSPSNVFQSVAAGSHYLATNSPYRGIGTTNIDPGLLVELTNKTTWPPLVYSNVVFAGTPQRAFVTCSQVNTVQVFDPTNLGAAPTNIAINGEDPRSLAVSPDGTKVYAAIFESGNASTILGGGGAAMGTRLAFPPDVVSDANGPYGGVNPPPNSGAAFSPPIAAANLPTNPVGLIVKKNAAGQWMDDNNHDWTAKVSGPNAANSGRTVGWDLPDRDLAIINTSTLGVTYATGLMNICMAVGVNPATGLVTVVGTDGTNELRFNTLRSLYYKVQSSTSLGLPFSDEPGGATRALEGWIIRTNPAAGPQKFYRVSASLTP